MKITTRHPQTFTHPGSAKLARHFCTPETAVAAALRAHWPGIRDTLKEQYLLLTDEDLHYSADHEDEFLAHLEQKVGRPREEFVELILGWQVAS